MALRKFMKKTWLAGSIVGLSAFASCAILLPPPGVFSVDQLGGSVGIEIPDSKTEAETDVIKENRQNPAKSKAVYTTVFFDDFNVLNEQVWTLHSTSGLASGGRYNARFRTDRSNVYVNRGYLVLDCSRTAVEGDGTYKKSNGEEVPVEYIAP